MCGSELDSDEDSDWDDGNAVYSVDYEDDDHAMYQEDGVDVVPTAPDNKRHHDSGAPETDSFNDFYARYIECSDCTEPEEALLVS